MNHYNKLIRDKIPEKAQSAGKKLTYHAAVAEEEFWYLLKSKLQEEITEFLNDQSQEQFADILDVLDAIGTFKKFDPEEVQVIRQNKKIELGGFEKKWVLEQSEESMGEDSIDLNQL
jgi:predicted house-cleaning noncanonical NTP pyrophosphatase (MazG superfamily)